MQLQTPRQDYETWLKDTMLLSLKDGTATIGASSPWIKESLEKRFSGEIRRELGYILGYPVEVRVVLTQGQPPLDERVSLASPPSPSPRRPASYGEDNGHEPGYANGNGAATSNGGSPGGPLLDVNSATQLDLNSAMRGGMLNQRYTFSRFIVGGSNRLAHAASLAVAEHPAHAYNPLFLYGGVGLGKTHLLHAIGNYALDRDPEINVLYVSSETFTNDLINSIRRQQTEEFRIRYRNIDILLIDDIQFIAGKDATQEEFFHTFNTLHSAAKQIVISSDRPPKAIVTLEERLRSRFEWGLIVDVQSPDLETRTAILRAKAEQLQVRVPDEVIDFLAHKIQSNIRQLEGSLNRVVAFASSSNAPLSVEVATMALAELLDSTRRKRITPDDIIDVVTQYYAIDEKILKGRARSRNIVVPRQVAMYLMREETEASLVEIGLALGGRDHTTVMHGYEKICDEINADSRLRSDVLEIKELLYGEKGNR
jgi:chromosomal replication initiator protein